MIVTLNVISNYCLMPPKQKSTSSLLLDIGINVALPSIILLRGEDLTSFDPLQILFIALLFPFCYGLYDLLRTKRFNMFSVLGFVSTALTGSIGILQLDAMWLAVKEALIPLVFGIAILLTLRSNVSQPFMKDMIEPLLHEQHLDEVINDPKKKEQYHEKSRTATLIFASSFFVSAILNFLLTRFLVVSKPGSTMFNEELGKLTALSYPVIVVPSLLVGGLAIYYLLKQIALLADTTISSLVKSEQ